MGTSLRLRGCSIERQPLLAIARALTGRDDPLAPRLQTFRDEEGRAGLAISIHPAAEPIRVIDVEDGAGAIAVEAETGTAGPGYHAHVCALLRGLPGITWERDPMEDGGYWEDGDRRSLERALDLWLRTAAMEILSLYARGHRGLQLSLPEGTTFEIDPASIVATPMGPRDRAWVERAAREPSAARDVFPWWEAGMGARVLRDAAIAAMWIDVRWRPPLSDEERRDLERVRALLEGAYALDPTLDYPWAEWSELCANLGDDSLIATQAHLRAAGRAPTIGYRRRNVRMQLSGGWSLRVPGTFTERWDERGTWIGWDAQRSIWFTSLEAQGRKALDSAATLAGLGPLEGDDDEEVIAMDRGTLRARARFGRGEDEGIPVSVLRAHAALGRHAAIGTLFFVRDADRNWALETWAGLAHVEESRVP